MALTDRDITIQGRLSFEHIWEPRAANENSAPKYSATLLIPKNDPQIPAIQAAIQAAAQDGVTRGIWQAIPDTTAFRYPPLRDGDTPTDSGEARGEEFAGHWFINASSSEKRPPFVVNAQMGKIINAAEVYSGCYINLAVQFFAYSNSGNKGISAALIGVQKVKDGERFGGRNLAATDVFSALGGTTPAAPAAQPAVSPNLGF